MVDPPGLFSVKRCCFDVGVGGPSGSLGVWFCEYPGFASGVKMVDPSGLSII